jgi:zona occludens toxin (predicted ATPase)
MESWRCGRARFFDFRHKEMFATVVLCAWHVSAVPLPGAVWLVVFGMLRRVDLFFLH